MKKRLKEMEDEAAALREMQAKVEKEMGSVQGASFFCLFFFSLQKMYIWNHFFLLVWKITFWEENAIVCSELGIFKIESSLFVFFFLCRILRRVLTFSLENLLWLKCLL